MKCGAKTTARGMLTSLGLSARAPGGHSARLHVNLITSSWPRSRAYFQIQLTISAQVKHARREESETLNLARDTRNPASGIGEGALAVEEGSEAARRSPAPGWVGQPRYGMRSKAQHAEGAPRPIAGWQSARCWRRGKGR